MAPKVGEFVALCSDTDNDDNPQNHNDDNPQIQLIRPDGESGDLDMDVEELIDACIEYSHVRSVELQVQCQWGGWP